MVVPFSQLRLYLDPQSLPLGWPHSCQWLQPSPSIQVSIFGRQVCPDLSKSRTVQASCRLSPSTSYSQLLTTFISKCWNVTCLSSTHKTNSSYKVKPETQESSPSLCFSPHQLLRPVCSAASVEFLSINLGKDYELPSSKWDSPAHLHLFRHLPLKRIALTWPLHLLQVAFLPGLLCVTVAWQAF